MPTSEPRPTDRKPQSTGMSRGRPSVAGPPSLRSAREVWHVSPIDKTFAASSLVSGNVYATDFAIPTPAKRSAADAANKESAKKAAKQATKQATAKQAEAELKTKKQAKAPADKATKGEATKEVAEHPMLSEVDAAPAKAKKNALSSRALMLIGVAAAFCTAFVMYGTKPSVASKLAEALLPLSGGQPPRRSPAAVAAGAPGLHGTVPVRRHKPRVLQG